MKRIAELDEARVLLQQAKRKLARAAELLQRVKCVHAECVKVFPVGPRGNGECTYVCADCGRVF